MDVKLHKLFCANVKRRRVELGLTQRDAARRMNVSQPTYAYIEAGRRNPGLDVVERVAEALDCDPVSLFAEADVPEKILA